MLEGRIARGARVLVVTAAVTAAGCSSSNGGSTGTGGVSGLGGGAGTGTAGGGGGAPGSGGAGGAAGAAGAVGSGGRGGSGGNKFANATPLVVGGNAASGTLADARTARNAYSFTGTKGEAIEIVATTGAPNRFDSTYVDIVLTLYGSNQIQIAAANHGWPWESKGPTLYTVLPATGTYYLAVDSCGSSPSALFCGDPSPITNLGYTIRVADIGGPALIREGTEPANDAVAGAVALTYTKAGGSSYVPLLIHGLFQSGTDRDTYTFAVPLDAAVAPGARARANFWVQPWSSGGDGSTTPVGEMYVLDPADTSGAHLVEIDATYYAYGQTFDSEPALMSFPVQLGKAYTLVVPHSTFSADANDFYFMVHSGGAPPDAPKLEVEPNNTLATADQVAASSNPDGTYTFTVDGNLEPAATDVDFHHLVLPSGVTNFGGSCKSQSVGSGVASFTWASVNAAGTVVFQIGEAGSDDNPINQMSIPSYGLTFRLSASQQLAGITDTSYVCRFVARP